MLNHSSIDPELTGKACNFWRFQFGQHGHEDEGHWPTTLKQPDIKKVYLLNQDYAQTANMVGPDISFGRGEMVGLARPTSSSWRGLIWGWGKAANPIGYRVRQGCPVQPCQEQQADSVITGNWGQDSDAAAEGRGRCGLQPALLQPQRGLHPGTVLAVSQAKQGQLTWVAEWHRPGRHAQGGCAGQGLQGQDGKDFLAPRIEMTPRFPGGRHQQGPVHRPGEGGRALEDLTLGLGGGRCACGVRPPAAAAPGGQHHLRRWAKP